ncbi:hypothetical protein OY671_007537, partial [Metschnikowia pulcherrima]
PDVDVTVPDGVAVIVVNDAGVGERAGVWLPLVRGCTRHPARPPDGIEYGMGCIARAACFGAARMAQRNNAVRMATAIGAARAEIEPLLIKVAAVRVDLLAGNQFPLPAALQTGRIDFCQSGAATNRQFVGLNSSSPMGLHMPRKVYAASRTLPAYGAVERAIDPLRAMHIALVIGQRFGGAKPLPADWTGPIDLVAHVPARVSRAGQVLQRQSLLPALPAAFGQYSARRGQFVRCRREIGQRGDWAFCHGSAFPLPAKADFQREIAAARGIVRRDHRVAIRQAPRRSVILRSQAVRGHQMPFQHLRLVAAAQAEEMVRLDRRADRNCRFRRRLGQRRAGAGKPGERGMDRPDQVRISPTEIALWPTYAVTISPVISMVSSVTSLTSLERLGAVGLVVGQGEQFIALEKAAHLVEPAVKINDRAGFLDVRGGLRERRAVIVMSVAVVFVGAAFGGGRVIGREGAVVGVESARGFLVHLGHPGAGIALHDFAGLGVDGVTTCASSNFGGEIDGARQDHRIG